MKYRAFGPEYAYTSLSMRVVVEHRKCQQKQSVHESSVLMLA